MKSNDCKVFPTRVGVIRLQVAVFNQIEQEFGRPLSPIEMETINDWLKQDHYQPERAHQADRQAPKSGAPGNGGDSTILDVSIFKLTD